MSYDTNLKTYAHQEALTSALTEAADEFKILEAEAVITDEDFKRAKSTGLDPTGRKITQAELTRLQEAAKASKRRADSTGRFIAEGNAHLPKLKTEADVKSESEAKTLKEKTEADNKLVKKNTAGRITGESAAVKEVAESEVVERARAKAKGPPATLYQRLTGAAPTGTAGTWINAFNPLAILRSPTEFAANTIAGAIMADPNVDPVNRPIPKLGDLTPAQVSEDPDLAAEKAMLRLGPGAGLDVDQRSRDAAGDINRTLATEKAAGNKELNKAGDKAYMGGVGAKVGQTVAAGTLALTGYGIKRLFSTPTVARAMQDEEVLAGDNLRQITEKLEPLRASANQGKVKELIDSRSALKKEALKSFHGKFGVNIETLSGESFAKGLQKLGMMTEKQQAYFNANKDAINEWSSGRGDEQRVALNTAMNELTAGSDSKDPVYLGKDDAGNRRFALYSKKLEKGLGGWTIGRVPSSGGELEIMHDNSDLDTKVTDTMKYKDYKKLPGAEDAIKAYRAKKAGTPPEELEF